MGNNLFEKSWIHVVIIILLGVLLYGYNISGWDLWNPDEPRYAQVAREMVETNTWMLPHLNGDIYHEKPPLVFWITAISYKIFGAFNEFTSRIPIAFLSVLVLLITYYFGTILFNPLTGFLAAIILSTSVEYFWLSRRLCLDIPLTFFFILSLVVFYRGYRGKKGKALFYASFFVFIGLATLAKGPVGFILPLFTVVLYLIMKKEFRELKEMRLGVGTLLFLLALLAWLVPAALQGGKEYYKEIVFNQTVNRFFDAWAHRQPFYYYFEVFPAGFAPWIVFFPYALIWCFQEFRRNKEEDCLFPLIWFFVVFGFFSFSTGKRELYLLPLYPAAAMITGKCWADYFSDSGDQTMKRVMGASFSIFALAMIIAGIVPFFLETRFHKLLESAPHINVVPLSIAFIVAGTLLLFLRKRKHISFSLIVLIMLCGMIYGVKAIMPLINPIKSAKPLSTEIVTLMKPGDELVIYKKETSAFNFYTDIYPIRVVKSREELSDLFTSEKRIFCLILKNDFENAEESLSQAYRLNEANIGHREYLLVSNRSNM